MSDETTKLAWDLVKAMAEKVKLPKNVEIIEHDNGSMTFYHHIHSASGCATIYFKPNIDLVKSTIESSDKVFADFPVKTPFSEELFHEGRISFTNAILYGFMKTFHVEIEEAFDNFFSIPALILSEMAKGVVEELDRNHQKRFKASKKQAYAGLDKYLQEQSRKKRNRLYKDLINYDRDNQPSKNLMDYFYSLHLPKWEEAKDCFKKNKQFKNWKQMVSLAFDLFPEDLIERLGDADPYNAMPSSIALEYASRLCNFEPNLYSTRNLQLYLKESRDWIKENGKEDLDNLLDEYMRAGGSAMRDTLRNALLFNIEPHFEDVSYIWRSYAEEMWDKIKTEKENWLNSENTEN